MSARVYWPLIDEPPDPGGQRTAAKATTGRGGAVPPASGTIVSIIPKETPRLLRACPAIATASDRAKTSGTGSERGTPILRAVQAWFVPLGIARI